MPAPAIATITRPITEKRTMRATAAPSASRTLSIDRMPQPMGPPWAMVRPEKHAAQRRRERERVNRGEEHRHRHRHGELSEQLAGNAPG